MTSNKSATERTLFVSIFSSPSDLPASNRPHNTPPEIQDSLQLLNLIMEQTNQEETYKEDSTMVQHPHTGLEPFSVFSLFSSIGLKVARATTRTEKLILLSRMDEMSFAISTLAKLFPSACHQQIPWELENSLSRFICLVKGGSRHYTLPSPYLSSLGGSVQALHSTIASINNSGFGWRWALRDLLNKQTPDSCTPELATRVHVVYEEALQEVDMAAFMLETMCETCGDEMGTLIWKTVGYGVENEVKKAIEADQVGIRAVSTSAGIKTYQEGMRRV
ncbi:hypothetical protein M231_04085 [Tremella mesenterica]|uniref:Uncharacterized protein n=1 Tax=Tremella mesenterica TaxID=5217 RepID=A0A4Q1BLB0_TREME|nr:uncharacterized protein TREMEDRAFT_62239 [Tremella mesenterica DSM 1558]EIW69372.1 hypothetical protein TREMEDRAFT_62239 [Tremella mesenterica DSM 1558]RXK38579.1 hypothetical protein M231_04085 [Tremella mesenterica]